MQVQVPEHCTKVVYSKHTVINAIVTQIDELPTLLWIECMLRV